MSWAKPCQNCGHLKTLHHWDYSVQQCQVDIGGVHCPCVDYEYPLDDVDRAADQRIARKRGDA